MPLPTRTLDRDGARRFIAERCLTISLERRVGVEIEWLPVPRTDPSTHAPHDVLRRALERCALPAGGRITFEPGGQVELSSQPHPDARAATDAIERDAAAIRATLDPLGFDLVAIGMDPRPHRRVIDAPRYGAMEAYFDRAGPEGRRMMRSTASIQINVESGSAQDADRRWSLAHALAPTLGAAFANSPFLDDRPSGFRSTRLANWWAMDPTRTWPAVNDAGAVASWTRYALAANVMLMRCSDDVFVPMREALPFGEWIQHGHALGYPTDDDLAYHLTTLFPPVRLRGWLELRFLDSLPDPWWQVAVAVTTLLLDDDEAAARAEQACAPAADLWHQAMRYGLTHPVLARAARDLFSAALDGLQRKDADPALRDAVAAYADRFVARGRTPADDLLDARAHQDRPIALEA